MKITGPENLQQTHPGSIQTSKGPDRASNFDKALGKALEPSDSTGGVQKSAPLSEPRAVQHIAQPSPQAAGIVDRTSRVIDLLDSYANALSNPQKTLRDIEPELNAFVNETQSLYKEYLESNRGDTRLKRIMEDLLTTARLEQIRFERGDYLDTD